MIELRRPEPLDRGRHHCADFTSTDPGLSDWLRRYAGQNRRRDTAAVWVVTTLDGTVVAYATLSATGIDRHRAPRPLGGGAPDPVPALLLGRLAVDERFQGHGVGTALVAHCLGLAIDIDEAAACRAVVVAVLDGEARSWWERLGFVPFEPGDPDALDLYLLTKDARTTIEAIRRR